jgi:hypothetical protein
MEAEQSTKGVIMDVTVSNKEVNPKENVVYFSQKTLIDNYCIKKKTQMVYLEKKITAAEYDQKYKEVHKEEARKLYPHKGRYILKEGVLTYTGDI